jgi:hypothetical protein
MSDEYRCVYAKNGAKRYYHGKAAIAAAKVPKDVIARLVCPQKGKALVEERTAALEKSTAQQKKRLEKQKEVRAAKKVSPKQVVVKSPSSFHHGPTTTNTPAKKILKQPVLVPVDYEFLRFFYSKAPVTDEELNALINEWEDVGNKYPYADQ